MRARTPLVATCLAAAAVVAAGSLAPASAAKDLKGSWVTPNLLPEPSNGGFCDPLIPQARATKSLTIPGPGTFTMQLNNKLDWSADVRGPGDDVLQSADAGSPEVAESVVVKFTKKTKIVMGACNLGGEPSVTVSWIFRPKKK
jgi:hypothetical protein